MIEPGKYMATLESHSITENKKGDPQVAAVFSFRNAAGPQKITWFGGFSEAGRQYTIKNLITLGLKGNNPAGNLEIGKQVEIVIDNETFEGKTRAKVKFINGPGAARNVIPQDLAKAKLSALEGAVMAARMASGPSLDSDSDDFGF
jgi:hypothetical protein